MTEPDHRRDRTGLWLLGARGSVATTTVVGLIALQQDLSAPTGVVTEHPPLDEAPLVPLDAIVVGGHDVVDVPLAERARVLAAGGVFGADLLEATAPFLEQVERDLRPAPAATAATAADAVRHLAGDLSDFRERHDLQHVVVVDVTSAEPPPAWSDPPASDAALDTLLEGPTDAVPASLVHAIAAIDAGCAYVDFTPGAAVALPVVAARAVRSGVPLAGRDGKTGETLLKTVLAPMFADRALRVRSWAGTNLLGGGDGARLEDPEHARGKLATKQRALEAILPDPVDSTVHIDHVPDLGEWKTAWDHVSFEGFLGTKMRLQFTWEGCDSTLAAPLVVDLARLLGLALRRGEAGPVPQLGFFFKDPLDSDEHRLDRQFRDLCDWAVR